MIPGQPMQPRKRILFVKYGSFSHVNGRVEEILRTEFPGCDLIVADAVKDIFGSTPVMAFFLWIKALFLHSGRVLRRKNSPWDFVFRDVSAWECISGWIARNADPSRTLFIFQTQSLFDASHPDIPFFIYTDHTHRAHRRHPSGGTPAPASPAWSVREEALYGKAATVFTLSDFCARSVIEDYGVPPHSVESVSTGINMELPRLERGGECDPVILFVGGDWGVKGGVELAAAFRLVRESVPEAQLWIVGDRPPVTEEGMTAFGRVGLAQLGQLFRKAAMVCVPSRVERASMLSLDAAAYALPVISTASGAGGERVRDGVTGLLVDPSDSHGFAREIVSLLADPDRRCRMGEAGRRMVEEQFTWKAVGAKMAGRIRALSGS